jgi:hypothetical protein
MAVIFRHRIETIIKNSHEIGGFPGSKRQDGRYELQKPQVYSTTVIIH